MNRILAALVLVLALASPALAQVMLGGSGAPAASSGSEGQFYFNTTNGNVYGPKAFGAWPSPTTPTYPGGAPGGSTLQVQYNNAGAFGGMSGTSWDNATGALTLPGQIIGAANGAASTSPLKLTGTWYTGGSATTTKPTLLIEPAGTTSANWSTSGTGLGVNAAVGFTGNLIAAQTGGVARFSVSGSGVVTASSNVVGASFVGSANSSVLYLGAANDAILSRPAAATFQLGAADAAAPVAQTLGVQSVAAGTSNAAGALWTQKGSAGTGTGVGGNIKWQVALAGGSGTAQNSFTDALTLDASAAVPRITAGGPIKRAGYAIASLPTGSVGDTAYVTDQLTACPSLGGTFTNGGNVVCSAFYNGVAWVHE